MKNKKLCISALAFVLALLMCASLVACGGNEGAVTSTTTTAASTTTSSSVAKDPSGDNNINSDYSSSLLALIDTLFENFSIYDVDRDQAMLAAIRAYVMATGDKYATYYTPEEWKEYATETNGDLYGIGVTVTYNYEEEYMEIVHLIPGSPASEQLKIGDKVTHFFANGKFVSIAELAKNNYDKYKEIYTDYDDELIKNNASYDAYQEAISNIKGEIGTLARIKVLRDGEELTFFIERAKVKSQSVIYRISKTDPSVGILWINGFDLTTPTQFKEAMDDLIANNVDKFVFDVRQNPGGNVSSVAAVLSTLLQKGDVILSTKDTNGSYSVKKVEAVKYDPPQNEGEEDFTTCNVTEEDIGKYRGYKMVVLADEDSASAAELFTAALRDYGLAEIVGTKTYGKGSMQTLLPLSAYGEKYCGVLRFTTKLYFPPCGEGYDGGIGIQPDHYVELSEEAKKLSIYKLNEDNDDQLNKAISVLLNMR